MGNSDGDKERKRDAQVGGSGEPKDDLKNAVADKMTDFASKDRENVLKPDCAHLEEDCTLLNTMQSKHEHRTAAEDAAHLNLTEKKMKLSDPLTISTNESLDTPRSSETELLQLRIRELESHLRAEREGRAKDLQESSLLVKEVNELVSSTFESIGNRVAALEEILTEHSKHCVPRRVQDWVDNLPDNHSDTESTSS